VSEERLIERMREDWNARAREDAHYWVAFGRRGQNEEEFQATAREIVRSLEMELKRLPGPAAETRRALEIGCGPGRLMLPLARHFAETHGVDISEEMIRLARRRLSGLVNAFAHHTPGSDLSAFPSEFFDFVYSYAVFQHIPAREIVFRYFKETRRVLKVGGIARFQVNGLPETAPRYDTWCGVRIGASELSAFARENDFQLLALEGPETQYLWTSWRKRPVGWGKALAGFEPPPAAIRRITNAHSGEPLAPVRGRFASVSLWVSRLADEADLNALRVLVGGREGFVTYIGPPAADGVAQVNVLLPEGLETGLAPVELRWFERPLSRPATLRLIRPAPAIPRVASVTDGVDLLSAEVISSGVIKAAVEEVAEPEQVEARLDGEPLEAEEQFLTDPRLPKWEINYRVPAGMGGRRLKFELRLGKRLLVWKELEVVKASE